MRASSRTDGQGSIVPNTNLTQRIITAALLAPLAILGVVALPTQYFSLALGAVVLAGAWEWAGLAGWARGTERAAYVLIVGVLLVAISQWDGFVMPGWGHGWQLLSMMGLIWWCVALGLVARFEGGAAIRLLDRPAVHALIGWLILLPAWAALVAVHQYDRIGPLLVLFLMAIIWGADTGAYFAGRRFGQRRLCPRTSPGKSWAGVVGGLFAAGLFSAAAGFFAALPLEQGLALVALSLGATLLSVLGDVTESLFKRRIGVKDSGRLLPGHGGVLDRIDSLTAAAPFFALVVYVMDLKHYL